MWWWGDLPATEVSICGSSSQAQDIGNDAERSTAPRAKRLILASCLFESIELWHPEAQFPKSTMPRVGALDSPSAPLTARLVVRIAHLKTPGAAGFWHGNVTGRSARDKLVYVCDETAGMPKSAT